MAGVGWSAIVLAGGRATRLGGVDKVGLVAPDGTSALDCVLAAVRAAGQVVVVGPYRLAGDGRTVLWTREDPPYGGPARAIAAGLAALGERADEWVLVVAGDMPGIAAGLDRLLSAAAAAPPGVQAVMAGAEGRRQWVYALYRVDALRAACARLTPGGTGESVRWLVGDLVTYDVPVPAQAAHDLDTPEDAARWTGEERRNMDEFAVVEAWLADLRAGLDLDGLGEIDLAELLSVVRTVAHGVIHPAGPVAMFAAGYAAARAGGTGPAIHAILARTTALADAFVRPGGAG